jgi:hypothetical protein
MNTTRRRAVHAHWLWALVATTSGACSGETEPRTQLMLVADTDVAPSGSIQFEIVGPDERRETKDGPFGKGEGLPSTLALVYTEGDLGPFTVSASIESPSGGGTIKRTHVVSFVRGKTLMVPLHLAADCASASCGDQQTCNEAGNCVDRTLSGEALAPWDDALERTFGPGGTISMDASIADASTADGGDGDNGASDAATDAAATDYQDCSGDYVDLQSNPDHCGSCDVACSQAPTSNATGSVCASGICQLACEPGFYDCNDQVSGCETEEIDFQTSRAHCGGCNMECPPIGGQKCMSGVCK